MALLDHEIELYSQPCSGFTMWLVIREEVVAEGRYIINLAERFISTLLLPHCYPEMLYTRKVGAEGKLNEGKFTLQRWELTKTKLEKSEYDVVMIYAKGDEPNRSQSFDAGANSPKKKPGDFLFIQHVSIHLTIPYLRRFLAYNEKNIEALLDFGKEAWNGLAGGMSYGYGNITICGPRYPRVDRPRPHAIPVAYDGVDSGLERYFTQDLGIKGAFWTNFLNSTHVRMLGGEAKIREQLSGFRIDPLESGGLLILATDSPLPEDTKENQERFLQLHRVLQPAFISLKDIRPILHDYLGNFYREREQIIP